MHLKFDALVLCQIFNKYPCGVITHLHIWLGYLKFPFNHSSRQSRLTDVLVSQRVVFCICQLFQFDTSSNGKSVSPHLLLTESVNLLTWMKLITNGEKKIEVFLFACELISKYFLKLNSILLKKFRLFFYCVSTVHPLQR